MRVDERISKGTPTVMGGLFLLLFTLLMMFGTVSAQSTAKKKEPLVNDFFMTVNTEALWTNSNFDNMGFGLKIGTMRRAGWYLSLMSNFRFNGAFNTSVPSIPISPTYASTSYLDGLIGLSVRRWRAVTWQLGAGFAYRTHNYNNFYNNRYFHYKGDENMGPLLATGFMFDMGGFLLSTEFVGFYDINHSGSFGELFSLGFKVGMGFRTHTKKGLAMLKAYDEIETSTSSQMNSPSVTQTQVPSATQNPTAENSDANKSAEEPQNKVEIAPTVNAHASEPEHPADTSENVSGIEEPIKIIQAPSVETGYVINVTENSAQAQGRIYDDGGGEIVESGFCFGTMEHPTLTIAHHIAAKSSGKGGFSAVLDRLLSNTTYFVRAYAINEADTSYGEQSGFTTKKEIPAVSTTKASKITATSAITGGNLLPEKYRNRMVEKRGVCYDTVENPSIFGPSTSDGVGVGEFTSTLVGLQPASVYYVRAYAGNADGVDYGEQISFTTLQPLYTIKPYDITDTTATTGGYDLYDRGGVKVLEWGVCRSVNPHPTLKNKHVRQLTWNENEENVAWTSTLRKLEPNTTYYARAYAITASKDTIYGTEVTFTTKPPIPKCGEFTVSDVDGNEYHTVRIGTQCWLKENMRTTHYADGTVVNPDGMMSPGWDSVNVPVYGYLYDWPAAVRNIAVVNESSNREQGICPAGWHVPSRAEWQTLFDYVKSQPKWVNGKSKTSIAKALSAQERWNEGLGVYPDCFVCKTLTTNNGTGFSALPAGYYGGDYDSMGASAYFWASTCGKAGDEFEPYSVSWGYDRSTVDMRPWMTDVGCSVRCLKD